MAEILTQFHRIAYCIYVHIFIQLSFWKAKNVRMETYFANNILIGTF